MSAVLTTLVTWRTALANAWANRAAFLLQAGIIVINDGTWIVFWGLFFGRIGTVGGWRVGDIYTLFSVVCTSAGIATGLLANSRWLGRMVADGELDETLVLPVSPLRHLLALRIDTPPIGDLIFGIGLFAFAATPTPSRILVFVVSSLAGAAVFTSFMVLCGSLTFFLGGRGEHGDMGFSAISMLAMYPVEIFGGPVRLVLFSVLPAALVSSVPADLLRHFNLAEEMALLGAAALISGLAAAVFRLGLRRYCSGSLWRT